MPGLVPGIHGTPTERQPLLNSRVCPQPASKADLLASCLVHLSAGRHITLAIRVELLRIAPVPGIEAGRGIMPILCSRFVRKVTRPDKRRYAAAVVVARIRLPHIHHRAKASAIRRNRAE